MQEATATNGLCRIYISFPAKRAPLRLPQDARGEEDRSIPVPNFPHILICHSQIMQVVDPTMTKHSFVQLHWYWNSLAESVHLGW